MRDHFDELSPDDRERAHRVAIFWNAYAAYEDPGGTNREVLENLQLKVTDCLYRKPPDIQNAERLTAKAMMLLSGWTGL